MADDPNQIDISLSLLDPGSETAIKTLVDTLTANTKALAAFQAQVNSSFGAGGTPMRPAGGASDANASRPTPKPRIRASVESVAKASRPPDDPFAPDPNGPGPQTGSPQPLPSDSSPQQELGRFQQIMGSRIGRSVKSAMPFTEGQFFYNMINRGVRSGISALPLVSPTAAQGLGEAAGLSRTAPSFLGLGTIPGAQYFSPAGRYGMQQVASSFWQGLTTPGISGKEIQDIKANLVQLGYGRNDQFGQLTDTLTNVRKAGGTADVSVLGPILDQYMRYGDQSVKSFTQAVTGLGDAAAASKMSVNEYTQALTAQAKAAEESGGNFGNAFKAIKQYSTTSGMPPEFVSALTSNPYVQMNLTQQTGLLPWEQGLLVNQNGGMDQIQHASAQTITQLMGIFQRTARGRKLPPGMTPRDLALADVQHLFPGMTTKTLDHLLKNQRYYGTRRKLAGDLNAFQKQYGDNQSASFMHNPMWNQIVHDAISSTYESPQATIKALKAAVKKDPGHPAAIAKNIRDWMNNEASKNTTGNQQEVKITLTGAASKYFRLIGPQGTDKSDAMRAKTSTVNGITRSYPILPPEYGTTAWQNTPGGK